MTDLYGYSLADRNRRIANQNAQAVDKWMAYAEKLKTKLAAVERERDEFRRERDELTARLAKMAHDRIPST
jgi:seryl-tRNA synthetase